MTDAERPITGATPPEAGPVDPRRPLSKLELLRISLYWLAISGLWAALGLQFLPHIGQALICPPGIDFQTCARLDPDELRPFIGELRLKPEVAIGGILLAGSVVAFIVQPVAAGLSDYTRSRLGRRRPWILVGTALDVVFLIALANADSLVAIGVLILLLQFSSNLAQGPFQGYVPDLVPEQQVGVASGLVGMMSTSGQLVGAAIAGIAIALHDPAAGILGLAVLEVATMLPAVFGVADRPVEMPERAGSLVAGARGAVAEAWSHRSFIWLLVSRLFILMAATTVGGIGVYFLQFTVGYSSAEAATAIVILLTLTVITAAIMAGLSGPLSDRWGRRQVIWLSCAIGAAGMTLLALAPAAPEVVVGAVRFPVGGLAVIPIGIGAGMFLSVDWALMVDIIPKVTAGRYMGISNVVTATSGAIAAAIGGVVIATTTTVTGDEALGPRAALLVTLLFYALGALTLRRVDTRPFEAQMAERQAPAAVAAPAPGA